MAEPENNEKRIALWPVRSRDRREGQNDPPYLTGHFTLEGEKFLVTLWQRDRTSDRQPLLSGHIEKETVIDTGSSK